MEVNIGNKIRELRKQRGITQEQLASVLNVSPQAVSKWEMTLAYPDMSLIPAIAGYFGISLDVLFDYNAELIKTNVERLIRDAQVYFFTEPKRYIETMENALKSYPGNDALLEAIITNHVSTGEATKTNDEIIELCQRVITQSSDLEQICRVKKIEARLYADKNDFAKAKEVLETLPLTVVLKNDAMAAILKGIDKASAAALSWSYHLKPMYEALMNQGEAWYHMEKTGTKFKSISVDEYIPLALLCYKRGAKVIEAFLKDDKPANKNSYVWQGMQTFHYCFYQRMAACYKKMGRVKECEGAVNEAYHIISTSWDDFEENRESYMEPYNQYLRDYGLEEYVR